MFKVTKHLGLSLVLFLLMGCVSHLNFDQGIANFRSQNYRSAFIKLKPEAEKGNPEAQYAVGYMYYYGKGVIEDRKKALFWINLAALSGQKEAQTAIKILSLS